MSTGPISCDVCGAVPTETLAIYTFGPLRLCKRHADAKGMAPAIRELRTQLQERTRERDEAQRTSTKRTELFTETIRQLRAQRDNLAEALKPFAEASFVPLHGLVTTKITYPVWEAARAALAEMDKS